VAASVVASDEGEADGGQPVGPKFVSSVDASHKRMVSDLAWLPPEAHVDARGKVLGPEHGDGRSYQFMSMSGDGTCLIWDTRFAAIVAGDLPHILKVRGAGSDKKRSSSEELPPWAPLFKMGLSKPNAGGDVSPCKLALLSGELTGGSSGAEGSGLRSTQFMLSTEDGEIALADWSPPVVDDGKAKKTSGDEDDGGGNSGHEAPDFVRWAAVDHARPSVSLQQSPFFPTLLLSVGDWQFTLWSLPSGVDGAEEGGAGGTTPGCSQPLFSSPTAGTYLTCGCWSPSRPGVVYIGRQDGCVDIWDLTDSSHKPAATVTVSSTRVTSMEFCVRAKAVAGDDDVNGGEDGRDGTAAKQKKKGSVIGSGSGAGGGVDPELMACGDVGGNLHVFEMPRNLWKPALNEHQLMGAFVSREEKRVSYAGVAKSLPAPPADPEAADQEEEEKVPGDGDEAAARETPEERAARAAEEEYQWLEAQVIEELGLNPDDLPEHWRKAKDASEKQKSLDAKEEDEEGQ